MRNPFYKMSLCSDHFLTIMYLSYELHTKGSSVNDIFTNTTLRKATQHFLHVSSGAKCYTKVPRLLRSNIFLLDFMFL